MGACRCAARFVKRHLQTQPRATAPGPHRSSQTSQTKALGQLGTDRKPVWHRGNRDVLGKLCAGKPRGFCFHLCALLRQGLLPVARSNARSEAPTCLGTQARLFLILFQALWLTAPCLRVFGTVWPPSQACPGMHRGTSRGEPPQNGKVTANPRMSREVVLAEDFFDRDAEHLYFPLPIPSLNTLKGSMTKRN